MARFSVQDVADHIAGMPSEIFEDMAEGSDDNFSMDGEGIINDKKYYNAASKSIIACTR